MFSVCQSVSWRQQIVYFASTKANKRPLLFSQHTRGQFHQHFTSSFHTPRSQKRKKILATWLYFALLGYTSIKAAWKHVDEIYPTRQFHQLYMGAFFVWMSFWQLFPRTCNVHVTRKKAAETLFERKIRT